MIYSLFGADVVMVCKVCGFQGQLSKLEHPRSEFNLCPVCSKANKGSVLIKLEDYQEQKLEEKLHRYLCCRNCGVAGLIENFPFKSGTPSGDSDDPGDERYCPLCISFGDVVNLADLQFCSQCGERPVEEKGSWCVGCDKAYEAAATANQFDED
ncbi:MAG: hypothetical protein Q7S12_00560 [bacterium]|nr:hypothetical protein [bacterium]